MDAEIWISPPISNVRLWVPLRVSPIVVKMSSSSSGDAKSLSSPPSREAYYVLVGGEAYETMGVVPSKREMMHTSLTYVASAYEQLRASGVPRRNIITIVQLKDYLRGLKDGQYPKTMYLKECKRLLDEGGADYDHDMVCPETVWSVCLGTRSQRYRRVVPSKGAKSLTIAIYSHGDSHPAIAGSKEPAEDHKRSPADPVALQPHLNPLRHEWFVHMPYPSNRDSPTTQEMLSPVAIEGSKTAGRTRNKPLCYLYSTQLRSMFCRLFASDPTRPVIALLNYCRSGGGIEFLRRPKAREVLGADKWPLFLMSSCQANHDALVGGLWVTWFRRLSESVRLLQSGHTSGKQGAIGSIGELFRIAKRDYHIENRYELKDLVKTFAFPSNFGDRSAPRDPSLLYDQDLSSVVCAAPDGGPDYDRIRQMQNDYKSGKKQGKRVVFWHPNRWGSGEVDLVEAVQEARKRAAIPEALCGQRDTPSLKLSDLF